MQPLTCFWLVALITRACAVPIFNVQGEQKAQDMTSPQKDVSRRAPANPVGYVFRLALQGRIIMYVWRLQHAQNYLLKIRPTLRRVFRNVENGGDDPSSRHESRKKRQPEHEKRHVSREEHRRDRRQVDHHEGPGGRADQHESHESHEHRLHSDSHSTDRHNTHDTHKHHASREKRPLSHSSQRIVPFNADVATSYLKGMTLKQLLPVHNKTIAIWHGIIDGDVNNNNDDDNDDEPVSVEAEDADVEGQEVENDEDNNLRVDDDNDDKSEEEEEAVDTNVHGDRSRTAVMRESLSLMSVIQQKNLLKILGGLMQSITSHNSTRPSHGQLGVADICCVVG